MLRMILVTVLIVCVVLGGWMAYKQWKGGDSLGSGEVTVRQTPNDMRTDIDGNQQTTTYDQNATPPQGTGAATNQPPADKKAPIASGSGTVVTGPTPVPQDQQSSMVAPPASTTDPSLPVSDTISPNPPNHAAFGGTGKFMWYRQGNLTWRVNTASGSTCIAFATMEEWQKQIVYNHGCGNA